MHIQTRDGETGQEGTEYPLFNNPNGYLKTREKKGLYRFFKRRFEWQSLDRCLRHIDDIYTVCDCPCGPGRLFAYWKKKGYDIIGVDLTVDMVEHSRSKIVESDDSVHYEDAFWLNYSNLQSPDLVASIRFLYYFQRDERIALLRTFAGFAKKYVLVQYKTDETLSGRKKNNQPKARGRHKYFKKYNEMIEELNQAGLRCLRIVPKGDSSDRVFILAGKSGQDPVPPDQARKYVYNYRGFWFKSAAVLILCLIFVGAGWMQLKQIL